MPDPSTRATSKYSVRKSYSIPAWIEPAVIQAALAHGITQADVVRRCLEHGLPELFGIQPPSPRP